MNNDELREIEDNFLHELLEDYIKFTENMDLRIRAHFQLYNTHDHTGGLEQAQYCEDKYHREFMEDFKAHYARYIKKRSIDRGRSN